MSILDTNRSSDVLMQEVNLSQIIKGASSSIACFVVVSDQGRTDPVHFTDPQSALTEYGNPDARKGFGLYTMLDYSKEGDEFWMVRAVGSGALYSGVLLGIDEQTRKPVLLPISGKGIVDPTNPDWGAISPLNFTVLALFYPNKGPGSYGQNLGVAITSGNLSRPEGVELVSDITGGSLNPGTYEYQISALGSDGSETLVCNPATIIIAGTGTTNTVGIKLWGNKPDPSDPSKSIDYDYRVSGAVGYRLYGRTQAGILWLADIGNAAVQYNQVVFTDDGSLTPSDKHKPITSSADLPEPQQEFTVSFYQTDVNKSTPVESFVCTLGENVDGNGNSTELESRINPFSQYMQVTSNVINWPDDQKLPSLDSIPLTNLAGGDSGTAPTDSDINRAWDLFKNKELYDVNSLVNGGRATPTVQLEIDAVAQSRGDAVGLLDVPSNAQQFQQAIDYRNLQLNLNSTYSALFSPDVLENDNINGKQLYVPFSGWAAALCARTDRVANPAFSIAGLNRGIVGVLKTRYTYDEGQRNALFRAQVNYTRTFIGQGIALWEQQTLSAQQSALSWLSVRRIVNVIKKSLYSFLLYSVHEPNDDFTGRQIVGACSDYLQAVKNARGITAFSVISDSTNNTPTDFNSAIRNVWVIIVPTLPIHIINLKLGISKQGVSDEEVLAALGS
jgi:hypothetical protein